ncbi:MAG: hypothetical protein IJ583_14715, partial [Firmicutes bacterium]|nr:hypothetical protein [Bacillota bacterium]
MNNIILKLFLVVIGTALMTSVSYAAQIKTGIPLSTSLNGKRSIIPCLFNESVFMIQLLKIIVWSVKHMNKIRETKRCINLKNWK